MQRYFEQLSPNYPACRLCLAELFLRQERRGAALHQLLTFLDEQARIKTMTTSLAEDTKAVLLAATWLSNELPSAALAAEAEALARWAACAAPALRGAAVKAAAAAHCVTSAVLAEELVAEHQEVIRERATLRQRLTELEAKQEHSAGAWDEAERGAELSKEKHKNANEQALALRRAEAELKDERAQRQKVEKKLQQLEKMVQHLSSKASISQSEGERHALRCNILEQRNVKLEEVVAVLSKDVFVQPSPASRAAQDVVWSNLRKHGKLSKGLAQLRHSVLQQSGSEVVLPTSHPQTHSGDSCERRVIRSNIAWQTQQESR